MKYKYLFDKKRMDYDEYLQVVSDMITRGSRICSKDTLEVGVDAITKIDDPIKRKKMINTSLVIDREFTIPYSNSSNTFKKLPIILTLANMMENHYELIKDLNSNELTLLSFFSFVVDSSYMKDHLKMCADHNLLASIIEKTPDIYHQSDILGVIEDKFFEFDIDVNNKSELDKFKRESATFVRSNSEVDLLNMVKPFEEIYKELEEKGIRL